MYSRTESSAQSTGRLLSPGQNGCWRLKIGRRSMTGPTVGRKGYSQTAANLGRKAWASAESISKSQTRLEKKKTTPRGVRTKVQKKRDLGKIPFGMGQAKGTTKGVRSKWGRSKWSGKRKATNRQLANQPERNVTGRESLGCI